MLKIHEAIRSGSCPNSTTLARDLEVSLKSVQRDLAFMRDRLGLPLAYDERRWGFYYTEAVSSFPAMQITEGELFALLVAEKAVQQYRGTNFERPLLSALRKMAAALPDTVSLHFADWDQAISFRTRAEPILDLSTFDTLARATAQRQRLEMAYRKPGQSRVETRLVDPYHLGNINGEWFLFAHDHARHDLRTFALPRILSARPTGVSFPKPEGFSLDHRLRDSFAVHSGDGQYEVVLQFDPGAADYIREKRWHSSQQLRELASGGVELRLTLSSLVEIERWVLSWAGRVSVVQPRELADAVREAGRRIADRGGGGAVRHPRAEA